MSNKQSKNLSKYRDFYLDKGKNNNRSLLKNTEKLNEIWKNKRTMPIVSSVNSNLPKIFTGQTNIINSDLKEVKASKVDSECPMMAS